jgi:hypothetical protein
MVSSFLPGLLSDIREFGTPEEVATVEPMLTEVKERLTRGEKDTPEVIEAQYDELKRKYQKEITQKAFEIAMGTRTAK